MTMFSELDVEDMNMPAYISLILQEIFIWYKNYNVSYHLHSNFPCSIVIRGSRAAVVT